MSSATVPPKKQVPAAVKRPSSPLGGFKRVQIGFGVLVQLIVIAAIVLMVNAFAYKHYKRYDFSRDHKYALSQRTKQYLASLTKKVKIIVFMNARSPLLGDVSNLVQEYRTAQPKFIEIEQVDPYRFVARATEIQSRYKLNDQESVVIIDATDAAAPADKDKADKPDKADKTGERTKIIRDVQMADIDPGNEMFQQEPKITAFKGEQAITGGLIEVTEGKPKTVYYLRGHGAPLVTERGSSLELVGKMIETEHVALQELNLLNAAAVPADAGALLLLGLETDLSERESQLLDEYWAKGGRLMVLLNPDKGTPRLREFLARAGVVPDDDRLMAYAPFSPGRAALTRNTIARFQAGSVVTAQMQNVDCVLLGATQTLTLRTAEEMTGLGIKLTPLALAVTGYWGETNYQNVDEDNPPSPDGPDKRDPLVISAAVEKGAVSDQRVQAPSSRMMIMGNARWVQPDALDEKNYPFFLSSLNWLLAREGLIGGIPPKPVKTFTMNLPDSQVQTLFWVVILATPGFFALLGAGVWWARRS